MDPHETQDKFVQLLTEVQPRLYSFVFALVSDSEVAADLAQEVSLTLWKNKERFEPESNFAAWAISVARYQVMTWYGTKKRDRVKFDEVLLSQLAQRAEKMKGGFDARKSALNHCIAKLPEHHSRLVKLRYHGGTNIAKPAKLINRSEGAVTQALHRIRVALASCIRIRLAKKRHGQ
jgi:RNA polymerase sigma-70 factor (ECF subfamily)